MDQVAETPELPEASQANEQNKDARMWGMLCHLSSLVGYSIAPGCHFIGPLVVWLIKKDEYPFVDDQGKEALNFQITILIMAAVSAALIWVFCIGVFLLIALAIFQLVMTIVASVKANSGEYYRYPMTLRLVK